MARTSAVVRVSRQRALRQLHRRNTVDQGVVHFGVHSKPAVVQPLHHVQLPQRAVAIEQAGMQP